MPDSAPQRVTLLLLSVQAEVGRLMRAEQDRRQALGEWLRHSEGEDRRQTLEEIQHSHGVSHGLSAGLAVLEQAARRKPPTG